MIQSDTSAARRSRPFQKAGAGWEENPHRRLKLDSYSGDDRAVTALRMIAAYHGISLGMAMERIVQNRMFASVLRPDAPSFSLRLKRRTFPRIWIHPDYLAWIKRYGARHRLSSVSAALNALILEHFSACGYELNPVRNLTAPLCTPVSTLP